MSEAVPRLLDLRAVAEMWSVSPHTVRKWVKQGRLRPLRICRRLLFHPDECARFLHSSRTSADGGEATSHHDQ
jgi:predicted site-specific integrase-resolvase